MIKFKVKGDMFLFRFVMVLTYSNPFGDGRNQIHVCQRTAGLGFEKRGEV